MQPILCPYIRRAWYNVLAPGWKINMRVIFDYELLFIKEGHAQIIIDDKRYSAGPGDAFIFRPRQRHAIFVSENEYLVQPHIHFDLTYYEDRENVMISFSDLAEIPPEQQTHFRRDVLDEFFSPFPSYFHASNGTYMEQLLFDIIHAMENPRPFNEVYLSHVFLRLWEQVLLEVTYTTRRPISPDSSVMLVRQYIEQNDNKPLTLEELSTALHFSQSYIFRIFKKNFNISPMQYHTVLRVQRAKQMIRYTNLSITEIAEAVGFDSPQNFSRVFKKTDGHPPSDYRKTAPPLP